MKTPKRKAGQRKHWRDTPDSISCLHGRPWHRARSLAPNIETILGYISGDETAILIVNAWAFHAPVVLLEIEP